MQRRYFYDGNSNRTKVEDGASQVLATATYNNQDQMLTYGTKTYEYDDFGQLKTVLDSATNIKEEYTYNTIGALEAYKKTDQNTSTVLSDISYDNDAMGRRVSRRINGAFETLYIYDGGLRIVGEYNIPNAEFTQYVYVVKPNVPEYMIRGGVEYKIVSNEQGSVRFILEPNSGNIMQAINYDEFGNIINDTNPGFQPFGFAGGIYDRASKLTRFGARDYDAETGRWTAKDPIRFSGGDTNLYGYTFNDPVNFIDPEGKSAIGLIAAGVCTAMTIKDFRDNSNELDALKTELTKQSDKMNKCDNMDDFEREKKKFNKMQNEFSKRKFRDSIKSIGLGAICAALTAL